MARKGAGGNAAFWLFVIPILWAWSKCSSSNSGGESHGVRENAEWHARMDALAAADNEKTRKKQQADEAAARAAQSRAAAVSSASALQPWQRLALLKHCVTTGRCMGDTSEPEAIYDSARNPAERKQLEAVAAQIEKAQARASASLRCGDGTDSPSCTCGGGAHRGCCSHHGGVRGCSADFPN